jgi:hypothetical protein
MTAARAPRALNRPPTTPERGAPARVIARIGPGVALAWGLARAHAAEPVRLRYEAPPACPDESTFTERVRERTSQLVLANPSDLARNFTVTLSVEAAGAVGRVDFVDRDGVPVSRVVRGDSCDAVASSLALVTALALDAAPNEIPEPPPLEPPPEAAKVPQHETPSPEPGPLRAGPVETSTGAATAGVGAGFVGWAGPQGGLSLDAFLGWSFRSEGPSLRLSAWHWRASAAGEGREATFRGWGARLEGCPWAFIHRSVFAEPCLGTNLGLFRAEGVQGPSVPHPETSNLFWRDVLLVGRLGARLGRVVVVEAQGELELPLFRHRFGFNDASGTPTSTVFEVPAVSGGAELHLGVRFQ